MLTVNVICVGKLKEKWLREGCAEYIKRLGGYCRINVVELDEKKLPDNPSQAQIDAALDAEGTAILSAADNSYIIAMCIEGSKVTSPGLSQKINSVALNGTSSISFVIGSSFGLANKVKAAAKFKISMSDMTFPHQLARVLLLEQIYRAFQISSGGKYHK
ncbi:MAG: 23S rRNA (pseudouridine(1915)-N(3))-methyltransferase RlmH [Oscillospiraceae bacterium]|nr:23S rRNA (pseudouridine(1915)-N(3))-methyltransferase RlmH [Oscillospiraceae bacterium]